MNKEWNCKLSSDSSREKTKKELTVVYFNGKEKVKEKKYITFLSPRVF